MHDKFPWLEQAIKPIQSQFIEAARAHQLQLTKPPGSLGVLEDLAVNLCAWQESLNPSLERLQIYIFAADHGIAEEKVSAFPQEVTAQMIQNFASNGAAISVLANFSNIPLKIINLGTVQPVGVLAKVEDYYIAPASQNFIKDSAMSLVQLQKAMACGREQAEKAQQNHCQMLILGEMGIANTTSAAAMASALLKIPVDELTGLGTGVDEAGRKHKCQVIEKALEFHQGKLDTPMDILQRLGGFEIAALCACYLRAAQLGLPVLVDGFIATMAAVIAIHLQPEAKNWMLFSHCSAEKGHRLLLESIDVKPLLAFDMRLGEGSGAALIVPLLRSACALHNQMASFEEAAVSNKTQSP